MDLTCEERLSDSSFVERVWRSQGEREGNFISSAEIHYGMVVTKHQGKTIFTVRGPEIRATPAYCPPDAEFIGIVFKPGTFIQHLPAGMVMDRQDMNLPDANSQSFWLNGRAWQFPEYENADTFVDWLVRDGLLVHDALVDAVIRGEPLDMSLRTVQRRFLQATGLTQGDVRQIERARYATTLLKQGVPILDAAFEAGYFDQPHLTRSLRQYIGLTPAQILDNTRTERLSVFYDLPPVLIESSGLLAAV